MSYTLDVKREILLKEIESSDEHFWEIYAILKGKLAIEKNKIELKLESLDLANRVYKYLKELNLQIAIKYSISKRFGEHRIYIIEVPIQNGFREFSNKMKSLDEISFEEMSDDAIIGFVRGLFLATGYIKDPQKEYALDFFLDAEDIAYKVFEVLAKLEKRVFITEKRNKKLVYLRNSEDIMDVLVMVGAVQSFFSYEEVTMMKDMKNKTIREINWEVANETKTLNTADKQLAMIEYIEKNIGLHYLADVLRDMAVVRLNNPESSLSELAEVIGLSKSGVRNRFRRIEEIYTELKEEIEKNGSC